MKTKVGKRYRITAYIERQMYEKFMEYKEETGFSESAIINLALYMFFSQGWNKNIQRTLLREFDKDAEGNKESFTEENFAEKGFATESVEENFVEKSFSTESFIERKRFTEIFIEKEKESEKNSFNKKEHKVFPNISNAPEEKPNKKEFRFFFELDSS